MVLVVPVVLVPAAGVSGFFPNRPPPNKPPPAAGIAVVAGVLPDAPGVDVDVVAGVAPNNGGTGVAIEVKLSSITVNM